MPNPKRSKIAIQVDRLLNERNRCLEQVQICESRIDILRQAEIIMGGSETEIDVLESVFRDVETAPRAMAATASGGSQEAETNWDSFNLDSVNGLSKIDTMAEMTRYAGGTVTPTDLARGMMQLGLVKASKKEKDVVSGCYGSITGSKRFKKVTPGVYRLVS